jgi:hypothetical protein
MGGIELVVGDRPDHFRQRALSLAGVAADRASGLVGVQAGSAGDHPGGLGQVYPVVESAQGVLDETVRAALAAVLDQREDSQIR